MHMADALLSPAVAGTMYAASAVVTGYSIKKINMEQDFKKTPLMGVMGAFVFAAQMINFTIPGTGSSGHLCGGLLLAALLGPYAGFITMIGVLLVQSLLFADGGLLALGSNVWNMAFYFCFVGYFLIYRPLTKNKMSKIRILIASVVGSVVSLQLGAFSVVLQTKLSGITELPFNTFITFMQPIHLAIGLVEGLITAAVLIFIYQARPELLDVKKIAGRSMSNKKVIAIVAVIVLLIGGGLSLFASSNPDGLEWSIENVTGSGELDSDSGVYQTAEELQGSTALLPDYAFSGSNSALGTSLSGILGPIVVVGVCVGVLYLIKFGRKHRQIRE